MKIDRGLAWSETQSGFEAADGTRLFYRSWQPLAPRSSAPRARACW